MNPLLQNHSNKLDDAESLKLLRLIGRIYAKTSLIENAGRFSVDKRFWPMSEYQFFEKQIEHALNSYGISYDPTATHSTYDGIMAHKLSITFHDIESSMEMPESIIAGFSSLYCKPRPQNLHLDFGFLGRSFGDKGQGFISDGLTNEDGTLISLDYTTHLKTTDDRLLFRLMHELAHVFGYEEADADNVALQYFFPGKDYLSPYLPEIRHHLEVGFNSFKRRIDNCASSNPGLMSKLESIAELMYSMRLFPANSSTALYANSYSHSFFRRGTQPAIWPLRALFL